LQNESGDEEIDDSGSEESKPKEPSPANGGYSKNFYLIFSVFGQTH
jgi:hypothetical protein